VSALAIHFIRPVIRPSKFLIPEEEDDGTGGRRRLMVAAAVYLTHHQFLCGTTSFFY
jgi:hypothetical protein